MRRFLVWLSAALIRLIGSTLRMTVEDHAGIFHHPDHPPVILAAWHNRIALLAYFHERYASERDLYAFISLSRDGQFIADIAARFGVKAVRGSSSRKGSLAALSAVRAAQDPRSDLAITPDGPRGPRYEIQPGLLRLAQATQRPIVAVTYTLSRKIELNSWDRFQIPLPFSTCRLVTHRSIPVREGASEAELVAIKAMVAEALDRA
jgi:lysophospholipid acyltransferase (LPLAT)-like uncharacterized protein